MLSKLKKIIKQAVCPHTGLQICRWHWCHGVNGDEPAMLELEYKCDDCGAVRHADFKGQKAKEIESALLELGIYPD